MRIAFIGGGHMSTSLVGGLIARGLAPGDIAVADPVPAQLERLGGRFGVRTSPDNVRAVRDADLVVLAVKPQDMAAAARAIAGEIAARRPIHEPSSRPLSDGSAPRRSGRCSSSLRCARRREAGRRRWCGRRRRW